MRRNSGERCDICGERCGEFRNIELLDGYICRDCAKKLSPWFTDFDSAEVEEIKEQLDGREEDQRRLKDFHPTRRFGEKMMVLVDDKSGTFIVTDQKDFRNAEPDILLIENVVDCSMDIDEKVKEIGSHLYRYKYTFNMEIEMDHPYVDTIKFRLTEEPYEIESSQKPGFLGLSGIDPEEDEGYCEYQAMGQTLCDVLNDCEEGDDGGKYDVKPGEFDGAGQEPEMTGEREPGGYMICPWCGSKVKVTDNFQCSNCGGPL